MDTLTHEFRSSPSADASPDLSSATPAARELASRDAARIGEMARDWWQRHSRSALDLADSVKHEAAVAGDRTRGYVRAEPLRSVLMAAAAGAVLTGLMMFFGRRR
jgi:ElaB/YqjD/DUF883 family membrane-anchored ribosome-binding protein